MLVLPQATTEALLEERALEIGVNVRRGHFVETVEQDASHVVISGRNREVPFRFFARYAVGAAMGLAARCGTPPRSILSAIRRDT